MDSPKPPGQPTKVLSENAGHFDLATAQSLVGKSIVISWSYLTPQGQPNGFKQAFGTITAVDATRGVLVRLSTGEEYLMPPDLRSFFYMNLPKAGKMTQADGTEVPVADLMCSWVVRKNV